MPYVYMGTHRVTGEFYIGSRYSTRQSTPSHLDLPKYKTSSKRVKPIFDEFDWVIVAEFFTAEDAVRHEQQMIYDSMCDPLSLNFNCRVGSSVLLNTDAISRQKMREARLGKPRPDHVKQAVSKAHAGKQVSANTRGKMKASHNQRHAAKPNCYWVRTPASYSEFNNINTFCVTLGITKDALLRLINGRHSKQHPDWSGGRLPSPY